MTSSDVLAVHAAGLRKSYGSFLAVKDLTLDVGQGDVYGLLGPNGAGKTTFLRMLFGLIRPDAGEIELFGQSVMADPVAATRHVAGFIETPRFYGYLSGRVNLELLAKLDRQDLTKNRIDEVLELVDLGGRGDDKAGNYSYGMRQRLGVAAALLRDPKLLVVDEPTNGLDPAGMRDMRALIKRLASTGLTVLLSSHNMLEVEDICQHVTIMSSGDVVFHGSLEELRAQAPEAEYVLNTPDPDAALKICAAQSDVRRARTEGGNVHFVATERAVEILSLTLGQAGIPLRSLAPVRAPLETLFFKLTGSDAHLHFAAHEEISA
jgi:ABC-2 type transport system ATP-binding protein